MQPRKTRTTRTEPPLAFRVVRVFRGSKFALVARSARIALGLDRPGLPRMTHNMELPPSRGFGRGKSLRSKNQSLRSLRSLRCTRWNHADALQRSVRCPGASGAPGVSPTTWEVHAHCGRLGRSAGRTPSREELPAKKTTDLSLSLRMHQRHDVALLRYLRQGHRDPRLGRQFGKSPTVRNGHEHVGLAMN